MTAYPFSGTIRNDNLSYSDDENTIIKSIVDQYCEFYKIDPLQLKTAGVAAWKKKTKTGVNVDLIRMALSYYIRNNFNLPYKAVAYLAGYTNHTTPIKNRSRIEAYIKNEDPVFYPYWEKLLQVA